MFQNRVNPKGEIILSKARGTIMGNRGVIHDANQNVVRAFKHKAWIACALQFKERRREVMTPGRWTELFFLDEATAFAAGHRPCAECRRENFSQFKTSWLRGNPEYGFTSKISIREIDNIIHRERIGKNGEKVVYEDVVQALPDGTFILVGDDPFLVTSALIYRWSPFGYEKGISFPTSEKGKVLTPKSIVNAFRAGYRPGCSLEV